MEDYGVAKGYIELDTKDLESNVKSAVKALEDLERKGALAESELNKLESQSQGTGNAFEQAQARAKELSVQMDQAVKKCGLYGSEIRALNTVIENNQKKQAEATEKIKKDTAEKEKAEKKVQSLSEAYKAAVKEIGAATKKYGENSQEVQELTAKHGKLIKSYENAEKRIRESENALTQHKNELEGYGIEIEQCSDKIIEFQTKLNNTQASIYRMSSELQQAQSTVVQWGQYFQDAGDTLQGWGDKLDGWGNALSLGITTPVVAAGTALGKMAVDSENCLARLQGQLGTTSEETERLQRIARNVYTDGYGESLESCISDIAVLRQNIRESADWTDEMTQNTLRQIETITELFDTNADEVTRTAQVMKSSGLIEDISDGLDIITYGFQNGADYSGEMLDTLREYSPQFVKLGLDGNEAMQYLIQGAENGAFNLDKVGDALKELSIRVVDGSDTTRQGFEAAGLSADEMAQKFAAGGDSAQQAFQETLDGLASIEDPVDRNIAGVNLFGTMWEDLGETAILSLAEVEGGLADIEGATDRAGESLSDTFSARASSLWREFKDALLPLGETLLDIGEDVLPVVEDGVETLTDFLSDLDEETVRSIIKMAGFAAALGPVGKTAGSAVKGVSTLADGFGKLLEKAGKTKAMEKAAETVADVGAAAVTSGKSVGGFSAAFSGLASPVGIGVGALAAGAVAAVALGKGIEKARKDAEKADLAEHFGDIELSAEEVEDIATRLTTNDWTMRVDAVIDAKEELEELETTIQESIESMNKTEWKVGIGLELTEEEKSGYQQSVTDYISGVQDYVEQQRYTANLAVDAVFEPGSTLNAQYQESLDAFYDGLSGEFTALGDELAELTNQAWEDGFLSDEELDLIGEKREEIQKKLDEIAQAEYDLELEQIRADATKDGISADSFQEMQSALTEKLDERETELEDTKRELLLPYQMQLNAEVINEEEFAEKKKEIDLNAEQQFSEIVLDTVNIETSTIRNNYADEVESAMNSFYGKLQQDVADAGDGVTSSWDEMTATFSKTIQYSGSVLKGAAHDNVANMLTAMQPEKERLEEVAESYVQAGQMVPESISQGLLDIYQLEAVTGKTGHLFELMAAQIAESPEYQEVVANAIDSGLGVPEELAAALESNYGLTYNATTGMFEQISQASADSSADVQNAVTGVVSDAGAAANDRVATITPDFVEAMVSMGAQGVIGMGTTVSASNLDAPGMEDPDWSSEASNGWGTIQGFLDRNPVSVAVKVVTSGVAAGVSAAIHAAGFANGGIATEPSIFGEDGPEMAIPLSQEKRTRALALYQQTGELLGISEQESQLRQKILSDFAVSSQVEKSFRGGDIVLNAPEIDYDLLADKVADRMGQVLRNAPIQPVIEMEDGDVYLDNERVGRKQAPVISRIMAQDT